MIHRRTLAVAALLALAGTAPAAAQPAELLRPGQPVVLQPGMAPPDATFPRPRISGAVPGAVAPGALYQLYDQAAAPAPLAPPPPYGYAAMGYGDGPPPLGAGGWRSGPYAHDDPGCRPPSGRGAAVGALSGAALGFGLANRRERGVGLLIGGLVGGLTGAAIERGGNPCR